MHELELARARSYINSYFTKQYCLDPEKHIHSPELYAVWNLKTYLVFISARLNPYNSEFFIYTDSGAWRGKVLANWPDQVFVRELAEKLDQRILYGQVGKSNDIIQGTFFGGSLEAVVNVYDEYFRVHDEWLDKGLFVGKDQNLMNELAFSSRSRSLVARLKAYDLNCNRNYDAWFFYQYYFANLSFYICENENKLDILILN
jgi:hypothetical protein